MDSIRTIPFRAAFSQVKAKLVTLHFPSWVKRGSPCFETFVRKIYAEERHWNGSRSALQSSSKGSPTPGKEELRTKNILRGWRAHSGSANTGRRADRQIGWLPWKQKLSCRCRLCLGKNLYVNLLAENRRDDRRGNQWTLNMYSNIHAGSLGCRDGRQLAVRIRLGIEDVAYLATDSRGDLGE
ncbi:predicted protein [Histoplasma capsulatum G186AR]|uniref:Uncharacterized protein n=1 Tax=Ajellomyces capsulatus (strain G186AR / H82 / ATCC MYA-2454 / RMSCC 2432) TaxID=447093 RepID=C0NMA7_AJECG|nr:uncharacterized protein HCBG_04637 [Histoplasma capsulatum G186AR]EEH07758.1 predicted protein [Histoplasma capsulatum G186AR]